MQYPLVSKNMKNRADPRLSDLIQKTSFTEAFRAENQVIIQGYPDDEAIASGGGRPGAKQGPKAIRAELAKLTPPAFSHQPHLKFWDVGDVDGANIEVRHATGHERTQQLLRRGHRVLSLGGGHDYGYCDGAAFLDVYHSDKPLIINFDAHLDVRDLSRGITSGTPFYRLLEGYRGFDFAQIGILGHCNSREHLEYVQQKGVRVVSSEEWIGSRRPLVDFVFERLEDWLVKRRPTYISLDMDVFSSALAPGVSAPQPLGLMAHDFWPLFDLLLARMDVRVLGIYEVSPPLDLQTLTARMAAMWSQRFMFSGPTK